MERYQHAVFFEANSLSDTDLKSIERYFHIKRRSGGGECQIYEISANTYEICFKDKDAQERVLTQKDHIINLTGQDRIFLRCVTKCDKEPKASDQQSCASAKPMEKVFQLDLYLLRYLSECTNATSDLNQRLSKLSSSFQINIDSEELVVVKDQDAQDSCPPKKWNFAVEQVLAEIENRYSLYFEVETDRLTLLRENSFLSNENLRIYDEETFAVVVGEREKVAKITKFIDAMQPRRQDQRKCLVSENQFALVKEVSEQKFISGDVKNNESECKPDRRIILLGKTGGGKSSTGNTILRKTVFQSHTGPESGTSKSDSQSGLVDGRQLTVIDTPGIFDTKVNEKTIRSEIITAVIECAPSVDALVIVLQLGRYTEHEEEVVDRIYQYFGKDTFKHAVILFTHGEQLKGKNIEEFVKKSSKLQKLVDDCEGRCHVIDNEYWNSNQSKDKNNEVQVRNLLDSIDKMVEQNGPFTSEVFLEAETDIQNEMKKLDPSLCPAVKRDMAKNIVRNKYLIQLAGVVTGTLVGAFLGIGVAIASVIVLLRANKGTNGLKEIVVKAIRNKGTVMALTAAETAGVAAVETGVTAVATEGAVAGAGTGAAAGCGIAAGCVFGTVVLAGAAAGGVTGYRASKEADSVWDVMGKAVQANYENAKTVVKSVEQFSEKCEEQFRISKK